MEFQPGTRWAYSATAGFDTLSRIVEVASGMPIDRFVKQRIFDPLEMKDTTYISPTGSPRLVKLYTLSLLKRPFSLRRWMLRPTMDTLLDDHVGAVVLPPDLRTWARSRAALQLEVLALRRLQS